MAGDECSQVGCHAGSTDDGRGGQLFEELRRGVMVTRQPGTRRGGRPSPYLAHGAAVVLVAKAVGQWMGYPRTA